MAESKGTEDHPAKHDELPEDERHDSTEQDAKEKGKLLMSFPVKLSNQDANLLLYEHNLSVENPDELKKDKSAKLKGLECLWCDVISVQKPVDVESKTFTVHYIEQQKNKALRSKAITLTCTADNYDSIFSNIQEQCQKVLNRPKRLFVAINPIGGNKKGVQIYEKKIEPIFKLANIETTVVVSERAKHAIEIGENTDFTGYDGIICVSGDGLYQELLEGYLRQLQKASGVDVNDSKARFVKPKIPFCLIPAGSSNGTVRYTNDGVIDLETSALRVLRGEIHPLNILTVHEPGKLVGICGLAFGVGLITDFLLHADQRRWMKKARYAYSIAVVLLKKRRFYDAEVEYILEEEGGSGLAEDGAAQIRNEWSKFDPEGKRHAGTVFLVSRMVDVGNKTIVDPNCKSGTVILDTGCSNWGFVKYTRTMLGQHPAADIPNLQMKDKALGLRVKILRNESAGDSAVKDGEGKAEKNASEKEEADKDIADEGEKKKGSGDSSKDESAESGKETAKDGGAEDVNTGVAEQPDESGKTEGSKQACSGDSKSGEKRNRKEEAALRALARDQELEHYIYLDGETRRVNGLEFECRLHAGFVPMFGCLVSDLCSKST